MTPEASKPASTRRRPWTPSVDDVQERRPLIVAIDTVHEPHPCTLSVYGVQEPHKQTQQMDGATRPQPSTRSLDDVQRCHPSTPSKYHLPGRRTTTPSINVVQVPCPWSPHTNHVGRRRPDTLSTHLTNKFLIYAAYKFSRARFISSSSTGP